MTSSPNCELLYGLFFAAVACAVLGNAFGLLAWKHRAVEQSPWRWLVDPSYAFRKSYYARPDHPARYAAMVLLLAGAVLVVVIAAVVIVARRSGATGICGFSF